MKTIQIFQYSIIAFIALTLISSCLDKEEIKDKFQPENCLVEGSDYLIPLVSDCRATPFPRQGGGITILPEPAKYTYGGVLISPSNPDEIVFHRSVMDSLVTSTGELWKMNICTGKKNQITTDIYGPISWSVRDWLAIHTLGNGTWIMKSNGDSLINLPNTYSNFAWSPDGNQLLTKLDNNEWALLDRFGTFERKLESVRGHSNPKWSPDGSKIAFNGFNPARQRIWIYDIATKRYHNILSVGSIYVWDGNDYLITPSGRDNVLVGVKYDDLARINIHTADIKIIKDWCWNRVYQPSSVSPDGKYLVATLILFEAIVSGGSVLKFDTKIVVMNLDGSNEREVVINW